MRFCYCPLYRAIFTFYFLVKADLLLHENVIALYIGLFSLPYWTHIIGNLKSYCPLYRAIFTNSPRIIFSTIRRNMETFLLSPSISGYFHGIEGEVVALPMKKLFPSISGYFHKYAKNVLEG